MELIFEWDGNKASDNIRKHKVSFGEAKTIFDDPYLVTYSDEFHSDSEDRYISIGYSTRNRVLLVIHTEYQETEKILIIRIISCRKATLSERKFYEED